MRFFDSVILNMTHLLHPAKTLRCLPRIAFCVGGLILIFDRHSKMILLGYVWFLWSTQNADWFVCSAFCITCCLGAAFFAAQKLRLLVSSSAAAFSRNCCIKKRFYLCLVAGNYLKLPHEKVAVWICRVKF